MTEPIVVDACFIKVYINAFNGYLYKQCFIIVLTKNIDKDSIGDERVFFFCLFMVQDYCKNDNTVKNSVKQ